MNLENEMIRKYPTKPIECWDKARELRRELAASMYRAKEEGKLVVQGILPTGTALLAGLGWPVLTNLGPNFGSITRDPQMAIKCLEAAESKGFRQDTCSAARINIGAMYLGIHSKSRRGDELTPDLCFDICLCQHQPKGNMVFRDYYGVPGYMIEIPPYTEPTSEHGRRYFINQMHEAIEWMEKTFKRKYDDEALVEATITEWETSILWSKCCELTKAIPAPIDMMRLFPLSAPIMSAGRHEKAPKKLLEILLAELEDRVRDGIAMVSTERCRLFHEGFSPFYYPDIYRFPRKYGAVIIGGPFLVYASGAGRIKEDGSFEVAKTPKERGIEIRTREDALESLAELQLDYYPFLRKFLPLGTKDVIAAVRDYHADGIIIHIDQGCRQTTASVTDVREALRKKGIPYVTYQSNAYDPRYFNKADVEGRFEVFLENLGLKNLEAS